MYYKIDLSNYEPRKVPKYQEFTNYNDIKWAQIEILSEELDKFKDSFFKKKAKIYEGNNFSPKIKDNEPLLNEIKYFFTCVKKNRKPLSKISR